MSETLESFRRAGIKLWMLTGDKIETALSIGHACKLLSEKRGERVCILHSELDSRAEIIE